jgi:hypothetical protein
MKLQEETFNQLITALKTVNESIYDKNARLFCGGVKQFPEFEELVNNVHRCYILYATINGKTLPVEHGINYSMIDLSRAMEAPKEAKKSCAYHLGLASHFDKPLEVLALETEAKEGIKPKWDIWMLRDIGDREGYIQNNVAIALRG